MNRQNRAFLSPENLRLLEWRDAQLEEARLNPDLFRPWWRPCDVRVLLVADGTLDFSNGGFGLSTFVATLLDTNGPARFQITLAHLQSRSGAAMMSGESRIKDRIVNFKFDDADDFATDKYDVVFVFGFVASLNRGGSYPFDRLSDAELQAIAEFQNNGGGLFATGDHGALGRFIGQAMPRARHMRLWDSTSGNNDFDRVSMTGRHRNDTNRLGDLGSQFDDQSDDIPQVIQPKIYSKSNALFTYSWPHPLLCGPNGRITVMPDHPHEGECVHAANPDETLNYTGNLGPEFPPAIDGGARPLPEVISYNTVLSGTESGIKDPTINHVFGGISAYDGHRAGIGRVVTDATWHHFVNINLIGRGGAHPVKSQGFLASPAGQAHLEQIKTYFRNLATWMSRKSNIDCINNRLIVRAVMSERVLEAVLTSSDVKLSQISPKTLFAIGRHARDVLGEFAGQCQTRRLNLDLVFPEIDRVFIPDIDPWFVPADFDERSDEERSTGKGGEGMSDGIHWLNMENVLDISLGAALVAVHERISGREDDEFADEEIRKLAITGAREGLAIATKSLRGAVELGARLA